MWRTRAWPNKGHRSKRYWPLLMYPGVHQKLPSYVPKSRSVVDEVRARGKNQIKWIIKIMKGHPNSRIYVGFRLNMSVERYKVKM